jgi:hypothetical protein
MGIVYLARDVQLDRDVAIKVLPADLAEQSGARERFVREARLAAGLSHPHIVPIHRVSESRGFVYFVMSYVEGETLGERLRSRGPLPAADAARILREVAWALAYAHGRGIVHRDVKPDNILLEAATGRALVTDFGIAHGGAERAEGASGKVTGTAHFMSPEQAADGAVDGRSDLYSLGVVGYLAVSGRLPFEASNLPAVLVRQATEPAPGVTSVAPGLPMAIGAVIDRCLQRDPADRFSDGEALAAALAPQEARPALPPSLRAWLTTRNPLVVPFMGFSAMLSFMTVMNIVAVIQFNRPGGIRDIVMLAILAASPLLPILGFHLNQARRQFRAGHSLSDLRDAIEVGRDEQEESDAATALPEEPRSHRLIRIATVGSATWLVTTGTLFGTGVISESTTNSFWWILIPLAITAILGAVSNALGVQYVPNALRKWWQAGIRDRLWNSRLGSWFAKRLGAPERSRLAGASAFRATEVALGVAAVDLFAALPAEFRDQLGELPAMVERLEARAAEARAEIELVAAMAPSQASGMDALAARRATAQARLADSVAALEGIRLDLLRLHANATDLAPLTTLMDAVRVIGEDVTRLAAAQKDVEQAVRRGA